jgi:hypothetical protein
MAEALIEWRPHTAARMYTELTAVKNMLGVTSGYVDIEIQKQVQAASRAIDGATGRRFWLDADNTQKRIYTPISSKLLPIDDVVDCQKVEIDRNGDGTFEETWTKDTDFTLEPANAPADFWPYERLRTRALRGRYFPLLADAFGGVGAGVENSVRVTGQFGWSTIPADIVTATEVLTVKLLKRTREAPFGIVTMGADQGTALRLAKTDPDIASLLDPYVIRSPLAP